MDGPNFANLAQHIQNMAQAAEGLAAEAHNLPNWEPAAQSEALAQVQVAQQQLQQQQMQQMQQMQQQQTQQLQRHIEAVDHNSLARLMNTRLLRGDDYVT
ncbi:hypothetical protein MNEG_2890 [Monoraphidium neglectum]|jgi:rhamnose utilization protein RhaD (predicted bifunctional aldolase and dehydrogenase)|uniref:Uncharacterized protein n=1 Tax=Monoraphidium neglectum TaxID=145388 RepID=A0A0D2LEH2_9CHLO|nr:hypothetical protein MNEG_2890 [Monoraphidium neglectum]KIZ05069.1 hypothetical protein MNEG_2890 [Monoraphidium neglectum]|eukprot:XP_013904088.1 hypothetical protein MNEG_2890 [Monoraphidium neglectum]